MTISKVGVSLGLRKKLTKKAKRLAIKAMEDPKLAKKIMNKMLLLIKKKSILPSVTKVSATTSKWRKKRIQLAKTNTTSRYWAGPKSNMTFTGRFLNSFKATVTTEGGLVTYEFSPTGEHKPYRTIKGKKSKSAPSLNEDIGKGFIARGDDYTSVAAQNQKAIAKTIKARVLKELKLNL